MLVKYNSLSRTEPPIFTLCNPGSTYTDGYLTNVVGLLTNHEAEEIVFNFNAVSELNFRIYDAPVENLVTKNYCADMYEAIKNRRLIFMDGVGYFVITDIDESYQDGLRYKDVKAESVDSEIQNKQVPYIENGTYRFLTNSNDVTDIGLFNKIVEVLPLWTIGTVDNSVASRYRTFEDVDVEANCLSFLLDNIQDAYECIILFDNITRTINVYNQSNYVHKTGIYLTKEDVVKSLQIKETSSDLYTAINVEGDNELGISAINPLGGNVLYKFDYYLDWMSSGLKTKVVAWKNAIASAEGTYYSTSLSYYNKLNDVADLRADIDKLDIQLKMYKRCRENIVANSDTSLVGKYNTVIAQNGGTEIVVYPEIANTLSAIDTLIASCKTQRATKNQQWTTAQSDAATYRQYLDGVNGSLAIQNYFTQVEYGELANYIYEGSYKDEYTTVTDTMTYNEKFRQMKILYDRAVNQLSKVSEPTQEFEVDVESVIFESSFSHWNDQLETGCLINVEVGHNDIAMLFLSKIEINYDDKTLKLTFGNRYSKYDTKSLFDKALGSVSKSANTLNYVKDVIYPIKDGVLDTMQAEIQSSRDITMGRALSSNGEDVLLDGSGYTGRKINPNSSTDDDRYYPEQIKITGENIVFTDDSWSTSKIAIGKMTLGNQQYYGINGEVIIGKLILGQKLQIGNGSTGSNTLNFDGNGLTVSNGYNSFSVNPNDSRLLRLSKINNNVLEDVLYFDSSSRELCLSGSNTTINLSSGINIRDADSHLLMSLGSNGYRLYGYDPNSPEESRRKQMIMINRDGFAMYDFPSENLILNLGKRASVSANGVGLYSVGNEIFVAGNTAKIGSVDANGDNLYWLKATQSGLEIHGDLDMSNYTILNNSDVRLKTNITDTKVCALDLLNQIQMKSFDWIDTNKHQDIGIIAQQLQEIIPDLVAQNSEGKLLIEPVAFIPYLIKAIQELSSKVD